MIALMMMLAAADLPAIDSGKGQVVLFRSGTLVGGAISCAVHENGEKLTSLHPGHYAIIAAEPGKHAYSVQSEAKNTLDLDVQAGQRSFVQCTIGMGFAAGHPHLTLTDEPKFDAMAGKLKPTDKGEK